MYPVIAAATKYLVHFTMAQSCPENSLTLVLSYLWLLNPEGPFSTMVYELGVRNIRQNSARHE